MLPSYVQHSSLFYPYHPIFNIINKYVDSMEKCYQLIFNLYTQGTFQVMAPLQIGDQGVLHQKTHHGQNKFLILMIFPSSTREKVERKQFPFFVGSVLCLTV